MLWPKDTGPASTLALVLKALENGHMAQGAMTSRGCCRARLVLANEFAIAARLFAEAVVLFTNHKGDPTGHEYSWLREAARKAQLRAEETRIAFEEHVDSHRCSEAGTS